MANRPLTSPEDQNVTFVELFFDLVFVFSITQVVGLLHDGLSWAYIGQAVLVFWLVWWAWTQFTWALNAADTTHPVVQLGVLAATGVAFFMAVALPGAFVDQGLWFAIAYVLVRAIGLLMYNWVTGEDQDQVAAVRIFSIVSLGGLAAVLVGGILGGEAQFGLWGLAILLDIIAASVGGQADGWHLHPDHFSERHGLFVIIALGETLIVAASQATAARWSVDLGLVVTLAVAVTCALWWSYFHIRKPALDKAFARSTVTSRAPMARDAYSLFHFPMLCGVIAYAIAVEEMVVHSTTPLPLEVRISLAAGLFLFVAGMIPPTLRVGGNLLVPRLILASLTGAAIVMLGDVSPMITLVVALTGVLLIAAIEQRTIPESIAI